jgi:antitoxin (DNA-binding transcriptional repressor) of toxin-antitoxin stability system
MTTISLIDAEKELAALIECARLGEEIVITDGTKPAVKLAPLEAAKPSYRGRGLACSRGSLPCRIRHFSIRSPKMNWRCGTA